MVDKPADVLRMDPAQPVSLSVFGRVDMALRKIPGLGILIAFALAESLWSRGEFFLLALFLFAVVATLAKEFISDRTP